MKKILILGSSYGNESSANGICMKNISLEFKNRGYQVFVISDSDTNEDGVSYSSEATIYSLKQPWFSHILKSKEKNISKCMKLLYSIISILRHLLLIPLYPNVSPIRSHRVYKVAEELIRSNDIDTVIATYRPFESIYTALKLKKKHGNCLNVIDFHLDILTEPNTSNSIIRKFQINRSNKVVKREVQILDKLILPESMRKCTIEKENIDFTDFPVYVPEQKIETADFEYDTHYSNIAYIGTLNTANRDPSYAVSFLEMINKEVEKPFMIHIWGNVEPVILGEMAKHSCVKYHGLVEHQYVMDLLKKADFLLNVTNQNTVNMLPSKIFQLFAAQKPILNFVKNRHDCSLPYFDKYGYTVNIYEDSDQVDQLKIVEQFIMENMYVDIPLHDDLLKKSTPGFFVDMIERSTNNDR